MLGIIRVLIVYLKSLIYILSRLGVAFPLSLDWIFNRLIRLFAFFFNTTANSHSHNNAQCYNTPNYYPDQSTYSYTTTFVCVCINRDMKELICGDLERAFNWGKSFTCFIVAFAFSFSKIFEPTFIQTTFMTRQIFDQLLYYLVFLGETKLLES